MDIGTKAWIAALVYCILSTLIGYFAIKKESINMFLQAGVFFLASLFCSYYAIFYFIGERYV